MIQPETATYTSVSEISNVKKKGFTCFGTLITEYKQGSSNRHPILKRKFELPPLRPRLLRRILPTSRDLQRRKQGSRRILFKPMKCPGCKAHAAEPQCQEDKVEARPQDAVGHQRRSDDGRNGSADAVAAVCCTEHGTRGLNIGAEDVVQRQAGCGAVADEEEAGGVSVLTTGAMQRKSTHNAV